MTPDRLQPMEDDATPRAPYVHLDPDLAQVREFIDLVLDDDQ